MWKCSVKEKNLLLRSIENKRLVVFIQNSTVFCYPRINLVWFIPQFLDAFRFAETGLRFHNELSFLKDIFLQNRYPASFIGKCFKTYIKKTSNFNCWKETRDLVFWGELSLQTRAKLYKVLKSTLSCCKINIVLKSRRKLLYVFRSKDPLPCGQVSCVVYKFKCVRCNSFYYDETNRHLKVRSGEHIGISPLFFNKVTLSVMSSIHEHLLFCDCSPSFADFVILAFCTN